MHQRVVMALALMELWGCSFEPAVLSTGVGRAGDRIVASGDGRSPLGDVAAGDGVVAVDGGDPSAGDDAGDARTAGDVDVAPSCPTVVTVPSNYALPQIGWDIGVGALGEMLLVGSSTTASPTFAGSIISLGGVDSRLHVSSSKDDWFSVVHSPGKSVIALGGGSAATTANSRRVPWLHLRTSADTWHAMYDYSETAARDINAIASDQNALYWAATSAADDSSIVAAVDKTDGTALLELDFTPASVTAIVARPTGGQWIAGFDDGLTGRAYLAHVDGLLADTSYLLDARVRAPLRMEYSVGHGVVLAGVWSATEVWVALWVPGAGFSWERTLSAGVAQDLELHDIAVGRNGLITVVGGLPVGTWVSRLDSGGSQLWSKSLPIVSATTVSPQAVMDCDGGVALYFPGLTTSTFARLDTDGISFDLCSVSSDVSLQADTVTSSTEQAAILGVETSSTRSSATLPEDSFNVRPPPVCSP